MLVTAAAAVALLVGWRSRTAAAICFVLVAGLHARNPGVAYGGDNLLRVLLFWMPWLPLPGAWAVPRGDDRASASDVLAAPGVFAIRLQLCIVYWLTAFVKLNSAWFGERDAVLTALYYDQFVTSWGKVLRRFPALMRATAPATVAVEMLGPLLVWLPGAGGAVRTLVVLGFVGFHLLGMGTALTLGIFPWVCAVAWTLFLPSSFWQRLRPAGRVSVVVGASGEIAEATVPSDEPVRQPLARRVSNAVVAVLVAFMVFLAAAEVSGARGRLPRVVELPATLLGIHQQWHMFMRPPRDDGWLIAAGRLAGGGVRDVWRDAPLDARKPESVAASFGNARWIKYLSQLNNADFVHHRRLFGGYLCRRWNESHDGRARLVSLQLYFVLEPTLPGGGDGPPRPLLIWQQQCR